MLNPLNTFKSLAVNGISFCNRYRGVPIAFGSSTVLSNYLDKRIHPSEGWSRRKVSSILLPYMLMGSAMAYHRASRITSAKTTLLLGTIPKIPFYLKTALRNIQESRRQEDIENLFDNIRSGTFPQDETLNRKDTTKIILSHLPPKEFRNIALVNKQFLQIYLELRQLFDIAVNNQWKCFKRNVIYSQMHPRHCLAGSEAIKLELEDLSNLGHQASLVQIPPKQFFEQNLPISIEFCSRAYPGIFVGWHTPSPFTNMIKEWMQNNLEEESHWVLATSIKTSGRHFPKRKNAPSSFRSASLLETITFCLVNNKNTMMRVEVGDLGENKEMALSIKVDGGKVVVRGHTLKFGSTICSVCFSPKKTVMVQDLI